MSRKTSNGKPDKDRGKERLGRCLVGGVGVSGDGAVTVIKPRVLPDTPRKKRRKAD